MPIERDTVLLENIRGCLNLYQRSIIWAMTTSAAFLLLSAQQFDSEQYPVKILYSEISLFAAYLVALALFFLIGGFAVSAIGRAELNLRELDLSSEMQKVVLLYPS